MEDFSSTYADTDEIQNVTIISAPVAPPRSRMTPKLPGNNASGFDADATRPTQATPQKITTSGSARANGREYPSSEANCQDQKDDRSAGLRDWRTTNRGTLPAAQVQNQNVVVVATSPRKTVIGNQKHGTQAPPATTGTSNDIISSFSGVFVDKQFAVAWRAKLGPVLNLAKLRNLASSVHGFNEATKWTFRYNDIRKVDLSQSELMKIGAGTSSQTDVTSIDLSHNYLTELNGSASLPHSALRTLNVGYNRLTRLSNFNNVCNLRELLLPNNALENLRFLRESPSVSCLEVLDVSNNRISSLAGLAELVLAFRLKRLMISGNPFAPAPHLVEGFVLLACPALTALNHQQVSFDIQAEISLWAASEREGKEIWLCIDQCRALFQHRNSTAKNSKSAAQPMQRNCPRLFSEISSSAETLRASATGPSEVSKSTPIGDLLVTVPESSGLTPNPSLSQEPETRELLAALQFVKNPTEAHGSHNVASGKAPSSKRMCRGPFHDNQICTENQTGMGKAADVTSLTTLQQIRNIAVDPQYVVAIKKPSTPVQNAIRPRSTTECRNTIDHGFHSKEVTCFPHVSDNSIPRCCCCCCGCSRGRRILAPHCPLTRGPAQRLAAMYVAPAMAMQHIEPKESPRERTRTPYPPHIVMPKQHMMIHGTSIRPSRRPKSPWRGALMVLNDHHPRGAASLSPERQQNPPIRSASIDALPFQDVERCAILSNVEDNSKMCHPQHRNSSIYNSSDCHHAMCLRRAHAYGSCSRTGCSHSSRVPLRRMRSTPPAVIKNNTNFLITDPEPGQQFNIALPDDQQPLFVYCMEENPNVRPFEPTVLPSVENQEPTTAVAASVVDPPSSGGKKETLHTLAAAKAKPSEEKQISTMQQRAASKRKMRPPSCDKSVARERQMLFICGQCKQRLVATPSKGGPVAPPPHHCVTREASREDCMNRYLPELTGTIGSNEISTSSGDAGTSRSTSCMSSVDDLRKPPLQKPRSARLQTELKKVPLAKEALVSLKNWKSDWDPLQDPDFLHLSSSSCGSECSYHEGSNTDRSNTDRSSPTGESAKHRSATSRTAYKNKRCFRDTNDLVNHKTCSVTGPSNFFSRKPPTNPRKSYSNGLVLTSDTLEAAAPPYLSTKPRSRTNPREVIKSKTSLPTVSFSEKISRNLRDRKWKQGGFLNRTTAEESSSSNRGGELSRRECTVRASGSAN